MRHEPTASGLELRDDIAVFEARIPPRVTAGDPLEVYRRRMREVVEMAAAAPPDLGWLIAKLIGPGRG